MKIAEYSNENAIIRPSDYADAIAVQNACNLSGVAHSFSRILKHIFQESQLAQQGTEWINHHPICVLYTHQMTFLAGRECFTDGNAVSYAEAHEYCYQRSLVNEKEGS